jgi:Co/Zn/Cd efflux system component
MSYSWLKFFHVAAVLALLGTHGASMFVLYAIRRERDRKKILDLISLSGYTVGPMYVSIVAIVVFGAWLWWKVYPLDTWWLWIAVVILVLTIGLMNATAKPYFARVKEACQVRPSGVPRVSDEELGEVLGSARAHLITAIGLVGLLAILYLMIFKPQF